ncbi:MAG: hypothetical protein COV47_04490, partial [Candidatus Diapherotrites archaeon CG11_big_fil_rev_8_21_14_0_20_37_9]
GLIIKIPNEAETRCITVNGICPIIVSASGCPKIKLLNPGPVIASNTMTPNAPAERKFVMLLFRSFRKCPAPSAIAEYVPAVTHVQTPMPEVKKSNTNIVANAK